jgi:hypothetical protein
MYVRTVASERPLVNGLGSRGAPRSRLAQTRTHFLTRRLGSGWWAVAALWQPRPTEEREERELIHSLCRNDAAKRPGNTQDMLMVVQQLLELAGHNRWLSFLFLK